MSWLLWIVLQWIWEEAGGQISLTHSDFMFFLYTQKGNCWISCFYFQGGISILFSTVAAPIYSPTNSAGVFPFLHILASTCYLLSFWWGIKWWLLVVFIFISLMIGGVECLFAWLLAIVCSLWKNIFSNLLIYISLRVNNVEHLFMYLVTIYMSSLEKCQFCPFLNWNFFFFCYCVVWILYIFF